jgi:hypothetical protein
MALQSVWTRIFVAMDRLVDENHNILHKNTIENAKLFMKFASSRYIAASEIGMGYWPTIRVIWSLPSHPIEIEIFEDRYELYRFADGTTEIMHVPAMQDCIPDQLKTLLDAAVLLKFHRTGDTS